MPTDPTLARKLGICAGALVVLDGAPAGFALGDLPGGVRLHRRLGAGPYDIVACWCPAHSRLVRRFRVLAERLDRAGALWVAWPKKASGVATDLHDDAVREHGLSTGLVDVKVCSVDATWSALKFVVRKKNR